MDNKVFNVNGRNPERLKMALFLAFNGSTAKAWRFSTEHGLILLWHKGESKDASEFIAPLTADEALPNVLAWLNTEQADSVVLNGWDGDCDHDGHNEKGWRVYVNDWGHVGAEHYAICAVTPAYLWLGK